MTRRWHIGAIVLMNRHFHPNAAKVFLNRFLSLEGQIAFRQANVDELRVGSMPEDLPQEVLKPPARRQISFICQSAGMDGFKLISALFDQPKKSG